MKSLLVLIFLVVAITYIIQKMRFDKKMRKPPCPRCSLGQLKEVLWMMHYPWSYWECDKCGAKLKISMYRVRITWKGFFFYKQVEDCDSEEWTQIQPMIPESK